MFNVELLIVLAVLGLMSLPVVVLVLVLGLVLRSGRGAASLTCVDGSAGRTQPA
jgi:hypothetical protein